MKNRSGISVHEVWQKPTTSALLIGTIVFMAAMKETLIVAIIHCKKEQIEPGF